MKARRALFQSTWDVTPNDKPVLNKLSFTLLEDGVVRQVFSASTDGGQDLECDVRRTLRKETVTALDQFSLMILDLPSVPSNSIIPESRSDRTNGPSNTGQLE